MALKKKPVTGMKDIMPREMEIRNYCMELVRKTYSDFGFTQIETPMVEHIENLCSNQGGENEKLIFKILKRGEKLDLAGSSDVSDLTDCGLRYDLTLPLSRFYAQHINELPNPFKALQLGSVFRADRPQRGRFRQFTQCDIDILGDSSALCEIELVLATSTLLSRLGFKDFTVRISDRRLLKAMALSSGIAEKDYDKAFIILDKMDKIGQDGVREELLSSGIEAAAAEKFLELISAGGEKEGGEAVREGTGADSSSGADPSSAAGAGVEKSLRELDELASKLGDKISGEAAASLKTIINTVEQAKEGSYNIAFDPTLVRGMGYYTGTIFEIETDLFGSSIAGGGRYDGMVGRFLGHDVSACGLSIGFERIITMLLEGDFKVPGSQEKVAFLLEKGMSPSEFPAVFREAAALRNEGRAVQVCQMMKNKKFQKEALKADGYTDIREIFN